MIKDLWLIALVAASQASAAEKIAITKHPVFDETGSQGTDVSGIQGTVQGVKNADDYAVVIYVRTDQYYIQPYATSYETSIRNCKNGVCEWSTETHLGKVYLALLFKRPLKDLKHVSLTKPTGGNIVASDEAQP
jgi:hypothetical protein